MAFFHIIKTLVQYGIFIFVCLGCDRLISATWSIKAEWIDANRRMVIAIMDNFTHGFIALYAWILSLEFDVNARNFVSGILCAVLSCAIDIDHFLLAGSWKLRDALRLKSRPPFHCTTILLPHLLLIILGMFSRDFFTQNKLLLNVTLLSFVAISTHHLRDAHRRGIWVWPLGSTAPLSLPIYAILMTSVPLAMIFYKRHLNIVERENLLDLV